MNVWIAITMMAGMLIVAAIFAAAVYNQLIGLGTNCENAFAQIEVQLKRRYDLIPNLVECVRSYMAHERDTLERVIAARNVAAAGLQNATRQPGDPDVMKTWMGAEGALTGALCRLSVVMEG